MKHRIIKIFFLIIIIFVFLSLLTICSLAIYTHRNVDLEADETLFKDARPWIVAFTTFLGLLERKDFVLISSIPASSITALAAPPAITPVPSAAGFINTLPAPNSPVIS